MSQRDSVSTGALDAILAEFPRERTQLLPALLSVQHHEGYLSADALSAIARHVYTPESVVYGVATSYSELRFTPAPLASVGVCTGLSCTLRGGVDLADEIGAKLAAGWSLERLPCRFRCDEAAVAVVGERYVANATADKVLAAVASIPDVDRAERTVRPERAGELRRLLARCGTIDPASIEAAISAGAYAGLRVALAMAPDTIVSVVDDARLLGRGGAYFPAAAKWRSARSHAGLRYLVVNAEEGEPGVFKDRMLMERDPHLLVEGIFIAARAVEAIRVFVYINGEAELATERLERALSDALARGLAGATPPRVEIRRGAGGYVCGEESVILSSIEGDRAEPRLRPPLPVERGLFGQPTVINNVETLCNLPYILGAGAPAFRSVGTAEHPGTKIICLSGAVRLPGVYEVSFGMTLRHIVEVIGGGALPGRTLRAVLCGGPSGSLLPPSSWDAPFAPNRLDDAGASPGAGGIVVIDDSMKIRDVVRHLMTYNAAESCGKCTPCREGTPRMRDLLDDRPSDAVARLDELAEAVGAASLCGLGQMAPLPYLSASRYFPAFMGEP